MNLLILSVGAALGAAARYKTGELILKYSKCRNFPLGTFLINTAGSLLLGVLCGLNLNGNPYVFSGTVSAAHLPFFLLFPSMVYG